MATPKEKHGIIFISCGQYRPEEIKLGQDLAAAVDDLTEFEGYFAQNQTSLEGLSRNIFGALDRCAGFVAVMHHRGNVETLPGSHHLRGSVWVEQEIAIAAFLTQARDRNLPVVVYIQRDIKREGVGRLRPEARRGHQFGLQSNRDRLLPDDEDPAARDARIKIANVEASSNLRHLNRVMFQVSAVPPAGKRLTLPVCLCAVHSGYGSMEAFRAAERDERIRGAASVD